MMEYWLISVPGDKGCQHTWETMNNLTSKQNSLSTNYKFHIPDLKVGTLDQLVGLSDDLGKLDTYVEQISRKVATYLGEVLEDQRDKLTENLTANNSQTSVDGEAESPERGPDTPPNTPVTPSCKSGGASQAKQEADQQRHSRNWRDSSHSAAADRLQDLTPATGSSQHASLGQQHHHQQQRSSHLSSPPSPTPPLLTSFSNTTTTTTTTTTTAAVAAAAATAAAATAAAAAHSSHPRSSSSLRHRHQHHHHHHHHHKKGSSSASSDSPSIYSCYQAHWCGAGAGGPSTPSTPSPRNTPSPSSSPTSSRSCSSGCSCSSCAAADGPRCQSTTRRRGRRRRGRHRRGRRGPNSARPRAGSRDGQPNQQKQLASRRGLHEQHYGHDLDDEDERQEQDDSQDASAAGKLPNPGELSAYITRFQWDLAKYPIKQSLRNIADIISKQVGQIDADLKTKSTTYNNLKGSLQNLEKKQTGSLLTRNLADLVKKEHFILDSEYLTTLLVIVPRQSYQEWNALYEKLTDMIVPRSSQLITQDQEYGLYTVTLFKKVIEEFKLHAREKKFIVRDFTYNEEELAAGKNEMTKLVTDKKKQFGPLVRWLKVNFSECFCAWIHVKALRVFVESVLRYGLPVSFQAILLRPNKKCTKRLRDVLNQLYAHLDSSATTGGSQSGNQDSVDIPGLGFGQSDYYPYVYYKINVDMIDIKL